MENASLVKPKKKYKKNNSLREQRYAKEYVRNKGNGTQAIIDAGYNVSSRKSASVVSAQYLQKPRIRSLIAKELGEKYPDSEKAEDIRTIAKAGIEYNLEKTTPSDTLKAIELAARLEDSFPDKHIEIEKKDLTLELQAKSPQELREYIKEMKEEADRWLQ